MWTRQHHEPTWGHGKLVAVLAGAVALAMLLIAGIGLAAYYTLNSPRDATSRASADHRPTTTTSTPTGATDERVRRDLVAARPMPSVSLDKSRPGPLSTRDPGRIVVPRSTRLGPADVPTGFPQTPQGAVGQLAALDQSVLQVASLPAVRTIIAEWAAPGGPTPQSWTGTKAMAELLTSAGLPAGGDPNLAITATPMMGLVKGTVGDDYVVACVLFTVEARLTTTSRVAAADCQRMVWTDGRWIIGPGAEPAPAPSTWPGTDAAIDVGYRDLDYG